MHTTRFALSAFILLISSDLVATAQPCVYSLNAGGQVFAPAGGSGSVAVSAPQTCPWTAMGTPSWVTLTSSVSGSGNGTLTYQVTANAGADRSAAIAIAGISFTVEQQAATFPGLAFIGSMAHLAAQENWTTALTLVNKDTISAIARLSLYGDALNPGGNGLLTLPLNFPQQSSAALPLLASSVDRPLAPNASMTIDTAGAQIPPVLVGSAQLAATGSLDGFAIFHQIATQQEAVVPLETRSASSYLLAFDNTNGLVLGVAVDNVSAQAATIPVVIRNDTGMVLSAPDTTISLAGSGHTSFVLADPVAGFPVTANIRGTIEFDQRAAGSACSAFASHRRITRSLPFRLWPMSESTAVPLHTSRLETAGKPRLCWSTRAPPRRRFT